MRSSLIALFILIASPLLILAAPVTEKGNLAVRGLDGKLEGFSADELFDHFNNLDDNKAKELAKKLTDEGRIKGLLEKIKGHAKIKELVHKLGVGELLNH